MELTIKDRLYIPAILPKEGNFQQFNLKKEILRKIEISDKEREETGLTENAETKRIEWDTQKDIPLNIEFSEMELDYLKSACEPSIGFQPAFQISIYTYDVLCQE